GYVELEIGGNSLRLDDFTVGTPTPTPFYGLPVTDDFNRANTGPPPGPLWTTGPWTSTDGLVTAGNRLKRGTTSYGQARLSSATIDNFRTFWEIPVVDPSSSLAWIFRA